jgi:predicted membrane GTPase involved in stress response
MDCNDLERVGVTILAKKHVFWHDYKINILDTIVPRRLFRVAERV